MPRQNRNEVDQFSRVFLPVQDLPSQRGAMRTIESVVALGIKQAKCFIRKERMTPLDIWIYRRGCHDTLMPT